MSKDDAQVHIGLDIGSISINIVVVSQEARIIEEQYIRTKGQPLQRIRETLQDLASRFSTESIASVSTTGSGGKLVADLLGGVFTNEVVAQARATNEFHPEVRTIVEMGGEDAKLIVFTSGKGENTRAIADFAMNAACAAGTGSFLDQQASRLGFTIEEFGEIALKSEHAPRIAGRCSVFAKSDMIHLQQIATPDYDIVAGLCYAVARNFKSSVGRGKKFYTPVAFQGGVAANLGVRRAFKDILKLEDGDFVIPEHFAAMGAIGATLITLDGDVETPEFKGLGDLEAYMNRTPDRGGRLEPLNINEEMEKRWKTTRLVKGSEQAELTEDGRVRAYLGIDVGSISTNLVVIDSVRELLASRYLMTAGRPIEAVRQGLREIAEEIGDKVEIVGVGTTGSGRYLIGGFVGADVIRNEITAQATAAIVIDPGVDTIFEIGGQDSKYISIDNGAVVDFEMNKVCAAGTGSFLEEQAERLGISIKEQFGDMALDCPTPCSLGDRCTVFIESDLVHFQQRGAATEELAAGLSYSIVHNYLNRVVGDRRVGQRIFFQGGTAFNKGVVAAFNKIIGKPVRVPENHHVTGAIGVAILAMEGAEERETAFLGWSVCDREYQISTFVCNECSNCCEIHRVNIEGERSLFYGSRCEKYEVDKDKKKCSKPDLFAERERMLAEFTETLQESLPQDAPVIGIPRVLFFHELLPFWGAFFNELGMRVVLSPETNKKIIHKGVEIVTAETCFPVKSSHGHVSWLIDNDVKQIFAPSIINLKKGGVGNESETYNCPYVQTFPYMLRSAIDFEAEEVELLSPVFHMGHSENHFKREIQEFGKGLGFKLREIRRALSAAVEAWSNFRTRINQRGAEVLGELDEKDTAVVIVGRPYNTLDRGINLNISRKFRDLDVLPIPFDFLPVEDVEYDEEDSKMYWKAGLRILSLADMVRKDPRLYAVYVTNFGCGPDSFVSHFFRAKMRGKPYLQLEIDEHSADAGAITRCEAFLDSLRNNRSHDKEMHTEPVTLGSFSLKNDKRTVYLPAMCDHSYAFAAAFRANGIDAVVLPKSDRETVAIGKKLTNGKECYPCILTTGDLAKFVTNPGFDPERSAFFMPGGNGPCRFGCYYRFHRMVLDDMGFPQVPVIAPNQGKNLYKDLGELDSGFDRLAWQGIVGVSLLEKLVRSVRPYESEQGNSDEIYYHYLNEFVKALESKGDLLEPIKEARKAFENVARNGSEQKPLIGVVGEIYVRSNEFSNEDVIRTLERLGAEIRMPPFQEWIYYLNFIGKRRAKILSRVDQQLILDVKERFQKANERKLAGAVGDAVPVPVDAPIEHVIELAQDYLDSSFEGEAVLSVGKSAELVEEGASGIVNLMPFTCMPGTIVAAVFKQFREDRNGIPVLSLAYDGQEQSNALTRIEAFLHQAREYHKKHVLARSV
ncbi:acyl-CoA dehydratase activase [Candidatus Hydrogenedentota bacterium]